MRGTRVGLILGTLVLSAIAAGGIAAPALALSPSVETLPATSVAETTATLNGKVNPNGLETKFYFEYGTTTSYGSKTSEVSAGSGTTAVEKSQGISGLSPKTEYHYRIVASNSSGTSYGADKTLTTVAPPEVLNWTPMFESSGEAVTLTAFVTPNGQSTTYQFEYGTSPGEYSQTVPVPAGSAGSGFESVWVSHKITGLTPGGQYYWRATASNAGGKAVGKDSSFASGNIPGIVPSSPSEIRRTSATLKATLAPQGLTTTYRMEYGTTTAYGSKTTSKEISGESASVPVKEPISGLKADTLYHYRVVAENSNGTHVGTDQTFETLAPVTLSLTSGEQLKSGTSVKLFSSEFTFNGGSAHTCTENEFSGEISENPGALLQVNKVRLENSEGARCVWGGLTIKYSVPEEEEIVTEFAVDGLGKGVVRMSEFVLIESIYSGGSKWGDCEYKVSLAGDFETGTALEVTLAGTAKLIKTLIFCPGFGSELEEVTGSFAVTSGGNPVEAKP
ncbi:MAG TPA: fibronectin type III domain-containing protein [Solirubrobacterales bacterium]|nr:fibronectin type III domain-containing protein [Solirubrobacterales bacterium]